ncbi:MAG: efflux RND transporter periplasmic adaptor subunit [Desulfovibrio sp.]
MKYRVCLLLVLILLSFISGCTDDVSAEKVIRPVVTAVVPEPTGDRTWAFAGVARNVLETHLAFRVDGEIVALPVKNGMHVNAGDIIAKLDPTDYNLALRQNKANLEKSRSAYVKAKADYERVDRLFKKKVVSKSELDKGEAEYTSSKAQMNSARRQLDISRQKLQYTTLRAPESGAISSVPVNRHQTVKAGQTIATLNSGQKMEMEIGVPESLISSITVGTPVMVSFDSFADATFPAYVSEVGVTSGSISTFSVKVTVDTDDVQIRSGMAGEVSFTLHESDKKPYTVVDAAAVFSDHNGNNFMWIYDTEKKNVAKRKVVVGQLRGDGLEVIDGLSVGEVVVTRGVHSIVDGQAVRLLSNGADKS